MVLGLAFRGSRWTWLAAGAAIPLAVPRVWLPDAAYVLIGLVILPAPRSPGGRSAAAGLNEA